MAKNVFISFSFKDGEKYKDYLSKLFDKNVDTVDFSEDINRSNMSEETIRQYLYQKLKRSSVTIILITPLAVNHNRDWRGNCDDWMYDEIRYSLEDRSYNRSNGIIAVYTPGAASQLVEKQADGTTVVKKVDNLFRHNMMNVKTQYKKNPKAGVYDSNYDSYCSLVPWDKFINNISFYIDIASEKRDAKEKYDIVKRI